jgi:hypothetical protein
LWAPIPTALARRRRESKKPAARGRQHRPHRREQLVRHARGLVHNHQRRRAVAACRLFRAGQPLAYLYYENEPRRQMSMKRLSRDEAFLIAVNIAKLPSVLRQDIEGHSAAAELGQPGRLIRAILLASAMAATFVGRRASDAASQGRCLVVRRFVRNSYMPPVRRDEPQKNRMRILAMVRYLVRNKRNKRNNLGVSSINEKSNPHIRITNKPRLFGSKGGTETRTPCGQGCRRPFRARMPKRRCRGSLCSVRPAWRYRRRLGFRDAGSRQTDPGRQSRNPTCVSPGVDRQ